MFFQRKCSGLGLGIAVGMAAAFAVSASLVMTDLPMRRIFFREADRLCGKAQGLCRALFG